jgi:aminoglycoside phosphotransferase family enzyme
MLVERVDDEGRSVLEDMQREHASIDPILAECAAGFAQSAAVAGASADGEAEQARVALVEQLQAGRANLDGHLTHEETSAIPLIQGHFTQRDSAVFEKAAQKDGCILPCCTSSPGRRTA